MGGSRCFGWEMFRAGPGVRAGRLRFILAPSARGGQAGVARFTQDGRLDAYFEAPVPLPTMIAFGGPDMSTLFITSGRLQAWMKYRVPDAAGSIFAVETSFRGVPESNFLYR